MTIAPTYITIDERMKRGLCSPLQVDGQRAGIWYHHIPGTDVLETVYDPRVGWHLTGGFIKHLTPGPSHVGGYFPPGAPLPQPTGRCQDRADLDAGSDPKNWKFIRMERDSGYESGVFEWIGPRLKTGYSVMYVPRERMHEMVGARGLGQATQADYARVNVTVWVAMGGSALLVGLGTKKLSRSTPMAVVAGAAAAIGAGAVMIRTGFWGGA